VLECLNQLIPCRLLIPCSLADLEILRDEIAALVELCVVIEELLQLEQGGLLAGVCLLQTLLSLGLLLKVF